MDRSGRIVLPRAVRDAAGLEPGAALDIVFRGGVVELVPAAAEVEVITKGRLSVAIPTEPVPSLSSAEVERVVDDLRGFGGE